MNRSTAVAVPAACACALAAGAGAAAAAPPDTARIAGCEAAAAINNLNFADPGDYRAQVDDFLTDSFKARVAQSMSTLIATAEAGRVRIVVNSVDCRIVWGDENHAEIAADIAATGYSPGKPPYALRQTDVLTMVNVGGRWLVDNIEPP